MFDATSLDTGPLRSEMVCQSASLSPKPDPPRKLVPSVLLHIGIIIKKQPRTKHTLFHHIYVKIICMLMLVVLSYKKYHHQQNNIKKQPQQ